ncbi:MAG: glycosyl hydrolase, partial [Chloroflexi bacterium]|nr:glycosyl hydrolase [Chloroflexota bacterium]
GLFQSDDNGDAYDLVTGLWEHPTRDQWFGGGRDHPGLHSVVVDPRDPERILAGISVGGVYASSDDGVSWTPSNKGLIADFLPNPSAEVGHDPHLLATSPSDPDVLWQQNHCGIFRSADGAKNWQKISEEDGPANFGFAIALDENDAETAWVVPAVSDEVRIAVDGAMCVSRTEDGGKTWQHFRTGLPQKNVYDFTFRHALDIRGERLMFGTSTGNLFVSEDRGQTWDCISNYLPPIYSVRFI